MVQPSTIENMWSEFTLFPLLQHMLPPSTVVPLAGPSRWTDFRSSFSFSSSSSSLHRAEKWETRTLLPCFLQLPPDQLVFLSMTLLNQDILHFTQGFLSTHRIEVRRGLSPNLSLLVFRTPHLSFIALSSVSSNQSVFSVAAQEGDFYLRSLCNLSPYRTIVSSVNGFGYQHTLITDISKFMHYMTFLHCSSSRAIHSPGSWGPLGSSPLPGFLIDWRDGPEFWCLVTHRLSHQSLSSGQPHCPELQGWVGNPLLVITQLKMQCRRWICGWCSQSCSGHFWPILLFLMPNRLFLWFGCFLEHTKATS